MNGRADSWNLLREHRLLLIAVVTMSVIVVAYWQSFSRMVGMWSLSTYQHGWLVYPIALYVLWRKRHALAAAPMRPSWFGVALTAFLVVVWMLARIVGVQVVEFASATCLGVAAFWAIAGTRALRAAAFPLALLLTAVPTGEFMVGYLQESTADISSVLLHFVGVPAYREGMFLTLPGGSFEVAEVCGGLRYLLAAALASLAFAYLTYEGLGKRVLFVAIATVTMVVANGVRAFIVMYVASATDMQVLAGRDHVYFGMVLFALVFVGLIYVGDRFADRAPAAVAKVVAKPAEDQRSVSAAAIVAVLLFVAAGPALLYLQMQLPLPPAIAANLPALPACSGPGSWNQDWSPEFQSPDYRQQASYDCSGHRADVYIAGYQRQAQGRELISSGNRIWPHEWRRYVHEATVSLDSGSGAVDVRQVFLSAADRSMLIWYWYQVGDSMMGSAFDVKLVTTVHVLTLQPAESSVIAVAVEVPREAGLSELQNALGPKARTLMAWYRDRSNREL